MNIRFQVVDEMLLLIDIAKLAKKLEITSINPQLKELMRYQMLHISKKREQCLKEAKRTGGI